MAFHFVDFPVPMFEFLVLSSLCVVPIVKDCMNITFEDKYQVKQYARLRRFRHPTPYSQFANTLSLSQIRYIDEEGYIIIF